MTRPTKPRQIDLGNEWWPGRESVEVIVPEEDAAVDTGLLDQFGQPIMRHPVQASGGVL